MIWHVNFYIVCCSTHEMFLASHVPAVGAAFGHSSWPVPFPDTVSTSMRCLARSPHTVPKQCYITECLNRGTDSLHAVQHSAAMLYDTSIPHLHTLHIQEVASSVVMEQTIPLIFPFLCLLAVQVATWTGPTAVCSMCTRTEVLLCNHHHPGLCHALPHFIQQSWLKACW